MFLHVMIHYILFHTTFIKQSPMSYLASPTNADKTFSYMTSKLWCFEVHECTCLCVRLCVCMCAHAH